MTRHPFERKAEEFSEQSESNMPSGCKRSIHKRGRSADTEPPELKMRRRLGREHEPQAELDDRPRAPSPCSGGSYVERIDGDRPCEWVADNWDDWLSSPSPKQAAGRVVGVGLPIFAQTPPSLSDPMVSWSARTVRPAARPTSGPARPTARPTARRLNQAPTHQFTALPQPAVPELSPGAVLWIDTATKWV